MLMYTFFNFLIQVYTFFQYHYTQIEKKYWKPFMIEYFGEIDGCSIKQEQFLYVKDGEVVGEIGDGNPEHDFIVNIYNTHHKIQHVKPISFSSLEKCESDIKFISMEIEINNVKMEISLHQHEKYNYYIDGNELNRKVFHFIINKYYSQEYERIFGVSVSTFKDQDYVINIIDHDVNMVSLQSNNILSIKKSSYEII